LRPRATAPSDSISFNSCLSAMRSCDSTLKARAISRLPTGVGLSLMNSSTCSRDGRPRVAGLGSRLGFCGGRRGGLLRGMTG
jgi:hypothetical protein